MEILTTKIYNFLGAALNSIQDPAGSSEILIINLSTAAICIMIASVPFALYKEALGRERWVLFFGGAFATLGIQYCLLAALLLVESPSWEPIGFFINSILSTINNLLFLAAARKLLDKPRAIPPLVYLLAFLALVGAFVPLAFGDDGALGSEVTSLHRLPDTILSVLTVLTLGWSLFSNIDPQWGHKPWHLVDQRSRLLEWRKKILAAATLATAWVYAFLMGAYGLFEELAKMIHPYTQVATEKEVKESLDFLFSATTFPLKFGLFGSAFYLIVRSLIVLSPRAISRTLDNVTEETRLHFLSSEGIVETIARSLNADSVQLYFKLPGHPRRRRGLACWCWSKVDDEAIPWPIIECETPKKSTIPGWILSNDQIYKRSSKNRRGESALSWWEPIEDLARQKGKTLPMIQSVVAVPIRYHNQTIAGLNIGWGMQYPITAIAVQRIRMIATMLIPTLETRRQLLAVSHLGRYFQSQEIVSPDVDRCAALVGLTKVVHATLSPAVTGVSIDVGFTTAYAVCKKGGNRTEDKELENSNSREVCRDRFQDALEECEAASNDELEELSFRAEDLTVEEASVGTLYLAQPHTSKHEGPSLAGDWLLESTVATMLSDALFDATRVRLWAILDRLQVELGSGAPLTLSTWFNKVENASKKAGVLWIVFEDRSSKTTSWRGREECSEATRNLSSLAEWVQHDDDDLPSGAWPSIEGSPINETTERVAHFRFHTPQQGAHHVVRLSTTPRSFLYLGIGRPEFGIELRKHWPWRIFLERFAIAAGASLDRMKLEQIRLDTKHDQGLITASIVTGTLVHQLSNMATNLEFGVENLAAGIDANESGITSKVKQKITALRQEIGNLQDVTNNINDATTLDSQIPSNLLKAAKQAANLYQLAADEQHIEIDIRIDEALMVSLPFYVPSQAIANLINNSIHAISKQRQQRDQGRIEVVAEDLGGLIYCGVVDNGPGISPEAIKDIFDLRYSTKAKGGGLGLYLARRTLRENGGDLTLVESQPGKTEFRLHLPKQWMGES